MSLLSGRNFETREFEQSIEENTYKILKAAVSDFVNETNFKRFLMIISSAGFCHFKLITSDNALDFAYALYLKLRSLNYSPEKIEKFVRRWLVLSRSLPADIAEVQKRASTLTLKPLRTVPLKRF